MEHSRSEIHMKDTRPLKSSTRSPVSGGSWTNESAPLCPLTNEGPGVTGVRDQLGPGQGTLGLLSPVGAVQTCRKNFKI